MIKIVTMGDSACPLVYCDWCRRQIEDGNTATYAYVMAAGDFPSFTYPTESEVWHVHNGRCFDAFEKHKERTEKAMLGTIPLDCLPIFLAHNLKVNWLKSLKNSRVMSDLNTEELCPRLNQDEWARVRKQVLKRDHYICEYCGSQKSLEVDHVIPISRGGSNDLENLVTACKACNRNKHDKTFEEWVHG